MPARRELVFSSSGLDLDVWTPSYLPAWSSREAAAATYEITDGELRLSIPVEHPVWCADIHRPPIRVSAVQSGNWSGSVGSTQGQQPFRDGLVVREAQPTSLGLAPHFGTIEVECCATIGPGSMFSAWMIGIEDEPNRCGEICLVEVFGDAITDDIAQVGTGIHCFRDPLLVEEFSTTPMNIDVARWHTYAVDWRPGRVDFYVDGIGVRSVEQAPDYPMELILGVFDFPEQPHDDTSLPELRVRSVRWHELPAVSDPT